MPSGPIPRAKKPKAKPQETDPKKIAIGVAVVCGLGIALTIFDGLSAMYAKAYPPPTPIKSEPIPEPMMGEAGKVVNIVGDSFESFMNSDKDVFIKFYAPWCGHCKALAPKYETLAEELSDKFDTTVIGHMDLTANEFPKGYDIKIEGYPTMLLFKKGDRQNPISFEGGREVEDMKKFILLGGVVPPKSEDAPEPVLGEAGKVGVIVGSTWETWMESDKDILVKFYAPWCGHCKALAPKYETLAEELSDKFDTMVVAHMNVEANDIPKSANVKVTGYPTLMLFKKGDRQNPIDYEGAREAEDLKKFMLSGGVVVPKSEDAPEPVLGEAGKVGVVVGSTFEQWMDSGKDILLEFYAPWCGHCKKLEPKYNELAKDLEDKFDSIAIAKMDATANDVPKKYKGEYKAGGFPTLYLSKADNRLAPTQYKGKREVEDLKAFVLGTEDV